jgi:hypothetical protein
MSYTFVISLLFLDVVLFVYVLSIYEVYGVGL